MVTSHKKMREPLDVGTEEQKTLEDWFDRNEYVPIDDVEDIVKDELEHEVTYGEKKRYYKVQQRR